MNRLVLAALLALLLAPAGWAASAGFPLGAPQPPVGHISPVQNTSGSPAGSGNVAWTQSFLGSTTTGDGVVVGLIACYATSGCFTTPPGTDPWTSVYVDTNSGNNVCSHVPGSYQSAEINSAPTYVLLDVWVCTGIMGGAGHVNIASSSALFNFSALISEWKCTVSGCAIDPGTGNNNGVLLNTTGTLTCTTGGTTSKSGDLIYSLANAAAATSATLTPLSTALNTLSANAADQYSISGSAGSTYNGSFTAGGSGGGTGSSCSIAAIEP